MIGTRIRPPIELPGGKKSSARRMRNPYCSRTGRIWYSVSRSRNANSTFEPSSGGIGIRLKIIRTMLIRTKQVEDLDEHRRTPADQVRVRDQEPQRDRADGRQDQVRERARGGDDRLAPSAAREVHRVDRRRLRPAEPEARPCDDR